MNPPPAFPATLTNADASDDTAALAALLAHFDCQAGSVYRMADGVLRLAAAHHLPPPVVELVRVVPVGKGLAGLAAQTRAPVSLCNLPTDPSGHARPAAKSTGMEGSIAVPMLTAEGELRGVLGLAKAIAHDWTDAEKSQLIALATLLAK